MILVSASFVRSKNPNQWYWEGSVRIMALLFEYVRNASEKLLPRLPGVIVAKYLSHQLHPHQVAQQGVDGDHLEEQEGPSHKHHHVASGEVVQEVLWRKREQG